ncbi:hypothetical protein [Parazoarcus communis]|uniref:Uncharacterized protein n=1 Tax=Parazoarcus communis SWub3 = DSM 12120 TaxID=1121029 RepID=A0A323UNW3_9RHOO|nr:hypothetical protein [Parazoarcus communis]NMG72734.1 hypothetical protein [Parazoarcus communis SWub3 = DSM 12120]PZA14662.1 hypothetical protein DNK49_20410 [Azoarcus communis] [Parazoarcus communis SWub3 = DSM 12120]
MTLDAAQLSPLPDWVGNYACLRPSPDHVHAARFTLLVSQLLPVAAHGLEPPERHIVEALLFARLMLDAGDLPADSAALSALDMWLGSTVFRHVDGSSTQRRAWWQVETLSIGVEVLSRWTQRNVLLATDEQISAHKPQIGQIVSHWIELARMTHSAGPEIAALYALEVSESLLDCAHAYGFKQAQSLRGARRQTRQDTTED